MTSLQNVEMKLSIVISYILFHIAETRARVRKVMKKTQNVHAHKVDRREFPRVGQCNSGGVLMLLQFKVQEGGKTESARDLQSFSIK